MITRDELQYQEDSTVLSEIIADPRQRRMIELRQQPRFLFELLPQTIINRKGFFDGDRDLQSLIDCFIDRAHPTSAQLTTDAITILQHIAMGKPMRVP